MRIQLKFSIFIDLADVGEKIFFEPDELYSVNELIDGVKINDKTHYILAGNTLRGFHRKNKKVKKGDHQEFLKNSFIL